MNHSEYARAEASRLTKQQISALAESVASQLGYEPCGDIYKTVAGLGGEIVVADTLLTDPEQSGSLYVEDDGKFQIVIPAHTSPARDRFTIAHELGHYVVHYLVNRRNTGKPSSRMMALRKDSDRVEWEANWFAAAFLMPSELFKQRYADFSGNADSLANSFCVSRAAADIRIRSLELGA